MRRDVLAPGPTHANEPPLICITQASLCQHQRLSLSLSLYPFLSFFFYSFVMKIRLLLLLFLLLFLFFFPRRKFDFCWSVSVPLEKEREKKWINNQSPLNSTSNEGERPTMLQLSKSMLNLLGFFFLYRVYRVLSSPNWWSRPSDTVASFLCFFFLHFLTFWNGVHEWVSGRFEIVSPASPRAISFPSAGATKKKRWNNRK